MHNTNLILIPENFVNSKCRVNKHNHPIDINDEDDCQLYIDSMLCSSLKRSLESKVDLKSNENVELEFKLNGNYSLKLVIDDRIDQIFETFDRIF